MCKNALLLIAVFCCTAFAAGREIEQPHIAVYGTAEVKVTPNEMNWQLEIRNEGKELPPTAAAHTEVVKKVLEFLKSHNVDQGKLQTSHMQFGENWRYIEHERVKVGYYASTSISFTISDFDLYQKIWYGLAQIDGVSIQNISYSLSDRIRYQNETREKALLAARDKAAALAKTLGSRIGEPLIIEETAPQINPRFEYGANTISNVSSDMGGGAAAQSLAPGQLTISTNVKVVFRLKN